jgi:dihydropyrimidine dehydrogenase (NAD+) subunit PreT
MSDNQYLKAAKKAYTPLNAVEEAARCLLCHDAPCSKACPAETNPEKFIRSIRFKNVKGAAETIRSNNILGGCCGLVCPYEKLCEEACSRTGIDKPIDIGALQAYAVGVEKATGFQAIDPPVLQYEKVAVIGGGPAGLSTAGNLAQLGYDVTIFEAKEKAGGMLSYGIIPARLPQEMVDYEIDYIKNLGVKIKTNVKVGKDILMDELKKDFSAVCVCTGLWASNILNDVEGAQSDGVRNAVKFLEEARSSGGVMSVPENVVVIGGGDVALDCASTAKLLGAKNVTILYRRTIAEMPASLAELEHVRELGVSIMPNFRLTGIVSEGGKVKAVKATGVMWKDRNTSVDDPETTLQLKAGMLIQAIGQLPEDFAYVGVALNDKKLIKADEDGRTDVAGVFAAGDAAYGGKTVVEAAAAGKKTAAAVDSYLRGGKK